MASVIIRDKAVSHGNILVNSDPEGRIIIQQGLSMEDKYKLKLSEEEALALYENLGNLIEWK